VKYLSTFEIDILSRNMVLFKMTTVRQLTLILVFIISTIFSACGQITGVKETKKLMQGKWVHTNDSSSSIKISNYQWTFEYKEQEIDSEDIYTITLKDILPEFVNKTEKAEFLILTNKSDTLQYEILGISDTTFSLMYFPSGKTHLYRRNQSVKEQKETVFFIKNESMYSPSFLTEFKARHSVYETVSLIDDTIIVNNDRVGHILIPTDLSLNQQVTYKNTENGFKQSLTVKRINYSTLEYNYHEESNSQKTNIRQGKADLEPVFYFGAEGTFEDENENVYGMNEYIDNLKKDCWTTIYIGVGSIEKSQITYGCETDRNIFNSKLLTRTK
jgi:hypothetical protein